MSVDGYFSLFKKNKKTKKTKSTTVQIKTWKTMNALEDGGRVLVSVYLVD